jgi:hypothetical protein
VMCPGVGPALPLAYVSIKGIWQCVRVLARLLPVPFRFTAAVWKGTGVMCPGVGPALPFASYVSTRGTRRRVQVLARLSPVPL